MNYKKIVIDKKLFLSLLLIIILLLFINYHDNEVSDVKYIVLKNFRDMSEEEFSYLDVSKECSMSLENYLFLGDSITHRYNIDKYFPDIPIVNSGVEGDTTLGILNDIENRVYIYNPTKIFLLIGTNQVESQTAEEIFNGIRDIVEEIKENREFADIYIESIYPVNSNISGPARWKDNKKIIEINKMIKDYSLENHVFYIDVYSSLLDEDDNLDVRYTIDGLHLNDKGYEVVTEVLKKYLMDC